MYGRPELDQVTLSVYRAILLEGGTDPARIARRLDIPEEFVSGAVGTLAEQGLLTTSWKDGGGLRAVSPDIGIKILAERERHEAAQRQQKLEQHRADLAAFAAEYAARSQQESLEGTESIIGADAIRVRLESLAESAAVEVASFQPDDLSEKALASARVLDRALLQRGVRLRGIYLSSLANQRHFREHIRLTAARGAEARVAPTVPMRLLLVDQEIAMLPAPSVNGEQRVVLLHFPPLVEAMVALYESYWQHARQVGETSATLPSGLTDQEQAVLRQLASGATDDTVARALGIGVRTERRIVAELMDRLGATSRFEAGVKAARLGLI